MHAVPWDNDTRGATTRIEFSRFHHLLAFSLSLL